MAKSIASEGSVLVKLVEPGFLWLLWKIGIIVVNVELLMSTTSKNNDPVNPASFLK